MSPLCSARSNTMELLEKANMCLAGKGQEMVTEGELMDVDKWYI